jgi:hypothetical protein
MLAICQCQNEWFWELFGTTGFHTLTAFRRFKSCEGEDHVSHACSLKKTSKMRVGVYMSYSTGNIVKLSANDVTVFKILTFWTYLEIAKLKVSQLEIVGKIREWDEFGRDTSDCILMLGSLQTLKSLRTDAKSVKVLKLFRGDTECSSNLAVIAYRCEEQFSV